MIDSSSPNQPIQNYEIVNPGLETLVATLLPSVAGYGGNLRSTNTIIPVVDVTAAAEGSNVPESLQFALAFGSNTAFVVENTTTDLIAVPGFYRVVGGIGVEANGTGGDPGGSIVIYDGATSKNVYSVTYPGVNISSLHATTFDLIVYLRTGDTLRITANDALSIVSGSFRQVADSTGTLITPAGF